MTTLIIPGVNVQVLREIVPPLPSPSGVLGIAGVVQVPPDRLTPVSSYSQFLEVFGPASTFTMPEVRQAFQNGVAEVVASPVSGGSAGTANLTDGAGAIVASLTARANGPWSGGITVTVTQRGTPATGVDVTVGYGDAQETFRNLSAANGIAATLNATSALVSAEAGASTELPATGTTTLSAGTHPATANYTTAIDRLELDPGIDMVMASMQDFAATNLNPDSVHAAIEAHCRTQSEAAHNRIGFGTVAPGIEGNPTAIVAKAGTLASDRFVLVAPHGVLGAVAGLIGGLSYYESPTFKRLSGVSELTYDYMPSELNDLIEGGVLAVAKQRNRGIIVVKGIDTTGATGQISVTRVADHAVRGVKALADLFIGTLNTEDGRTALRQKLTEFFLEMERERAIVPSVDGSDPSFKVDVYSTQRDFALGIVRVDIAVRPVRAIDFIYATILVQV
jgi:hypothetical protein